MNKKKILLVDDSRTVLMMEQMILQNGPFELLTATDGIEAVEKTLTEKPDMILLDIIMPNMNGYEVCRKLRKEEITNQIPIIMVTTRAEEKNVEHAFQSGCNDYITKPINPMELRTIVSNYLCC